MSKIRFYLWERTIIHRRVNGPRIYRRAHLLKEENRRSSWCKVQLDPRKWLIVEELPEGTYLCPRCKRLAEMAMTSAYAINKNKKFVYVTFPEKGGLAESLKVIHQLLADERMAEDFDILVDARVTTFVPTADEAREIASVVSNPGVFLHHPIAVVVSEKVQYRIASMISSLANLKGATMQPFYDIEEAEVWLRTNQGRRQPYRE
jgi:hypothetical protein